MSEDLLINILANDTTLIPYRKELNVITGGVMATILLSQMLYWYKKNGNGFYKFKEPCNNKYYSVGDSWCEELGFSIKELDSALKKLKQARLIDWKTDMMRLTYWTINTDVLVDKLNSEFMQTPKEDLRKPRKGSYVTAKREVMQTPNEDLHYRNNLSQAEITTEITTETTTEDIREGVCENRNASSPPQKNPSSKISKFKKPSLEEIKAYIKEQSLKVDSNVFYDHYESVGWAIGRNKMKDWRATLRNWHRRESGFKPNVSKGKFESSMSEEERNYYMGDSDIITPYNYATKGLGLKHD